MQMDVPPATDFATPQRVFDVERAIEELRRAEWVLPVTALRELQANRELAVPRLIRLIEDETALLRGGELPDDEGGSLFAIYLLAEFEAAAALPVVEAALSLPEDSVDHLFGCDRSETLARILLGLSHNSPDVLARVELRRDFNQSDRIAALSGYQYLVRDGLSSRSDAIDCVAQVLRAATTLPETPEYVAFVICELLQLGASQLQDEILAAFDRGLVEEWIVDRRHVRDSLDPQRAEQKFLEHQARLGPSGILDTVGEMQDWYCFSPEAAREAARPSVSLLAPPSNREFGLAHDGESFDDEPWTRPVALRSTKPQARPNDPCPCNSGKKFKKCCGRD